MIVGAIAKRIVVRARRLSPLEFYSDIAEKVYAMTDLVSAYRHTLRNARKYRKTHEFLENAFPGYMEDYDTIAWIRWTVASLDQSMTSDDISEVLQLVRVKLESELDAAARSG